MEQEYNRLRSMLEKVFPRDLLKYLLENEAILITQNITRRHDSFYAELQLVFEVHDHGKFGDRGDEEKKSVEKESAVKAFEEEFWDVARLEEMVSFLKRNLKNE